MMRTGTILAAMLIWAAPAQAQELVIASGETVTARLDRDAVTTTGREPAQLSAFERRFGSEADRGEHDDAGGATGKPISSADDYPKPVPAAPGTLRFTLAPTGGGGTLLSIGNGYDRALVYRATMWIDGKSYPTDVCLVLPIRNGIEHWPHRIDRMSLSSLRLVPWQEGDPVPCS